jgi:hypothetical protein
LRSRPGLLLLTLLQHPPLPLAPVIPPKNLPKLAHQLCVSKEIPCFTNEACSIDKLLGEEIHELEKLVVGVSVPQRTLDAVEEMCVVWWEEGRREGWLFELGWSFGCGGDSVPFVGLTLAFLRDRGLDERLGVCATADRLAI